jgi:hypothetical protein
MDARRGTHSILLGYRKKAHAVVCPFGSTRRQMILPLSIAKHRRIDHR